MSILILAQHDGADLNPATLNVVSAAQALSAGDIHLLIAAQDADALAAKGALISGVDKVLTASGDLFEHPLAETIAPLLKELAGDYSHILCSAGSFGKNIIPRVAALLDVQAISDITAVIDANTFERPVYAGNAIATVQSAEAVQCITVRGSAFDAAAADGGSASVESVAISVEAQELAAFAGQELSKSDRPDLGSANIVVSGGRGVGSAENFALIEALADKLGGAVGASRAAVDAGYVPNDYQVGQTGKIVAPDLYIAVGISGAIQHLAGMKGSKIIVAINTDEDAPIFQVADYGLVADLFDAVPEMTDKL